jgi:ribonuclease P protein subunit RPR2
MVRIAGERIHHLFGLAETEAARSKETLPDRYVALARRIGMRYNVRIPPDYRSSYCRGCSAYWVEGRTVRSRLRGGRKVSTCLVCGRRRRTRLHGPVVSESRFEAADRPVAAPEEGTLVTDAEAEFQTEEEESEDA